jgi:hypothetical protein
MSAEEITRFNLDMDGSMEPSDDGRWIRYEDHLQAIAKAEAEKQEPVDKKGSPCPEFWDWLPKAYNFDGDGNFTKYNMEVAFLAGCQAIAEAEKQEPVAYQSTSEKCRLETVPAKGTLLHTSPQPRKPLTRKDVLTIIDKQPANKQSGLPMFYRDQVLDICRAIEVAHGIKE